MIDAQTIWRRMRGRWASLRQVPALFLLAPSQGADDGMAQALSAFGLWCEAHPGLRCRIGLSGRWLLHSVSGAAVEAQSLQQQALRQWAHYLDLDEPTLMRDWVLREVGFVTVGLVCAVPRSLIEGLQQHAASHGVQLEWVGPWWAYGVQGWLAGLTANAAQPEGIRTLHLVEPELVTHVQAICSQGTRGILQRIWSDRDEGVSTAPGHDRVVLQAPTLDAHTNADTRSCLWDHAALQPVLIGADSCWKAQA